MHDAEWINNFAQNLAGEIVLSNNPGAILKSYRKRYGITQQDLSKILGVRRETISRIENGKINITFAFLQKFIKLITIAEAIKISRDQHIFVEFMETTLREAEISREELEFISNKVKQQKFNVLI